MDEVTMRELRNDGGAVIQRVEGGERLVVTRSGRPVAELRPVQGAGVGAAALLRRWRGLPTLDLAVIRTDLRDIVDDQL